MKTPELTSTSLKIDKLINRINDGEYKIPAFQRGYVWKQNQIIELIESLFKQYPIGNLLLWEASDKEKLNTARNIAGYRIPDKGDNWPVNYVLDGQQRLSTIYAVFSENISQDDNNTKYNPDLDIFEIYYDFSRKAFLPKSEVELESSTVVNLRNIIDPVKLIQEMAKVNEEYHEETAKLSSSFLNYEIPIVQIKNRTKEEVGVIFERINNTGTKLNILDLMTAWTWTEQFHLLDATDTLLEELNEKGFGAIDPKLIMQIISGIIIGSTKTESILELTGERVRDHWDDATTAIKAAIDFLSTQMKCVHLDFLPYHQQLVFISRFYSQNKRPSAEQLQILKKFFWLTSFSDRYSTGRTTTKMDADIDFINKVKDYDYSGIDRYTVSVTAKELIDTKFSKANPITRAFLILSAQKNPKDLINGTSIDLGKTLTRYNRKEYHHVFPNAFLTEKGVPQHRKFSVMNFCFLPADSNKRISSKKPSDYFVNLVSNTKKNEILESNLLPSDNKIYEKDNYDEFLNARAELIIDTIHELVK